MTSFKSFSMTQLVGALGLLVGAGFAAAPALAQAETPAPAQAGQHFEIHKQPWTFGGLFGYYDKAQLQRGYKVYKQVCANCHGLKLLSYRNLAEPGGPEFPKEVAEQIASEAQVTDGPNDQGEMFQRPGKLSDRIVGPFKNDKEAANANNGAVPPDLSLITKARGYETGAPWYLMPYVLLRDFFTQYQEQGQDYIYALLTGYSDPPAGKELAGGMSYNLAFPGNQVAMPQPLQDGVVDYEDKTPNTLDQQTRDVVAFLSWTAEPHLVERKQMGIWVMGYLFVFAVLLFLAKKALWRNVEH